MKSDLALCGLVHSDAQRFVVIKLRFADSLCQLSKPILIIT